MGNCGPAEGELENIESIQQQPTVDEWISVCRKIVAQDKLLKEKDARIEFLEGELLEMEEELMLLAEPKQEEQAKNKAHVEKDVEMDEEAEQEKEKEEKEVVEGRESGEEGEEDDGEEGQEGDEGDEVKGEVEGKKIEGEREEEVKKETGTETVDEKRDRNITQKNKLEVKEEEEEGKQQVKKQNRKTDEQSRETKQPNWKNTCIWISIEGNHPCGLQCKKQYCKEHQALRMKRNKENYKMRQASKKQLSQINASG